jgi:Uma2 family endonuclease
MIRENVMSAEAFWEFVTRPENADRRFELVKGEIREMAGGTGGEHGETVVGLTLLLGSFIQARGLGRMTGAETCYRLYKDPDGKDIVRCPDFAYVSYARAPQPLPRSYVPFAPDFALEVISPNNSADEIQEKVLDYLENGVALVWVVYPESQSVVAHTASGAKTYRASDTISGGDVFPDLSLTVGNLFAR